MKISLVIPTRERVFYLRHAINTALKAADCADCDIEVVISDNASSDGTEEYLTQIDDKRLVRARSDRRLSMRENFEFALSHTTGSNIVFIGDDDAVLPNGLGLLRKIIEERDPDIIKWRVLNYYWPNPQFGQAASFKIRPQLLDGRFKEHNPVAILQSFARADIRSYSKGGMIYHGCISRRLIERVKSSGKGPYFRGSSPDVFSSLQALMVTERPIFHIYQPITLGAASPRSNGLTGQVAASSGKLIKGTEFSKFVHESSADPWQCALPAKCKSIAMVTLDCLKTAAKVHGVNLSLDFAAWSDFIKQDLAKFDLTTQSECIAMARDHLNLELHLSPNLGKKTKKTANKYADGAAYLRKSFSKLELFGGKRLKNAEMAAAFLDEICNLDEASLTKKGKMQSLARILYIRKRTEKLFE